MVRPRTVSFTDEEMEKLGQEMLTWILQRPETLHLSQWYTIEKMFTYNEWKTFIQREKFIPYYEKALKLVGLNYLNKDSKVRDGISQRWQRVYFKDLKEEEDETAAYLERLKSDEYNKVDEAVAEGMEAVLKLMKARQSSARKADDSSNSNDRKSD